MQGFIVTTSGPSVPQPRIPADDLDGLDQGLRAEHGVLLDQVAFLVQRPEAGTEKHLAAVDRGWFYAHLILGEHNGIGIGPQVFQVEDRNAEGPVFPRAFVIEFSAAQLVGLREDQVVAEARGLHLREFLHDDLVEPVHGVGDQLRPVTKDLQVRGQSDEGVPARIAEGIDRLAVGGQLTVSLAAQAHALAYRVDDLLPADQQPRRGCAARFVHAVGDDVAVDVPGIHPDDGNRAPRVHDVGHVVVTGDFGQFLQEDGRAVFVLFPEPVAGRVISHRGDAGEQRSVPGGRFLHMLDGPVHVDGGEQRGGVVPDSVGFVLRARHADVERFQVCQALVLYAQFSARDRPVHEEVLVPRRERPAVASQPFVVLAVGHEQAAAVDIAVPHGRRRA